MSHSNPEFAVLASIMNKLQTRNEELRAKELRLRKQLQETKQRVAKQSRPKKPSPKLVYSETESASSYDEDTFECPRKCWPPPVESTESDNDTSSVYSEVNLVDCPYRPQFVASDISLSQSVSESTSVDSLQSVDLRYLQQLEAVVADERERIKRLDKLKQREEDIIRTAEVTCAVVDELQSIFNERSGPKKMSRCMGQAESFPTTPVPPSTPVEPVTPCTSKTPVPLSILSDEPEPPDEESTSEPQQQETKPSNSCQTHADNADPSHRTESMDLWTKTIANNGGLQEVISKHRASIVTTLSDVPRASFASANTRGQTTPMASVYVPTKTEYRLMQNDDPFRVASKVSRLPSLHDILESRHNSLLETEQVTATPQLKTITDILAGQKITPENAPLVCQNLEETKRRLSFMIEHSDECKNCEKFIKDHLKAIDRQLNALSHELEVQHFSGPVPGSLTKNSVMPAPQKTSDVSEPLGPTSTNLFIDRQRNLVTGFDDSTVSAAIGPASMETIMRINPGSSNESTWIDAHFHPHSRADLVALEPLLENQDILSAATRMSLGFLANESSISTTILAIEGLTKEPMNVPFTTLSVEPVTDESSVSSDAPQIAREPTKSKSIVSNKDEVFDVELTIDNVTYVIDHDEQSLLNEVMADIEEVIGEPFGAEEESFVSPVKELKSETSEETPVSPYDDVEVLDEAAEAVVESLTDNGEGTLTAETVDFEVTAIEVAALVTEVPELVDLTDEVIEAEGTGQGEGIKTAEAEEEDAGEVFYDSLEVLENSAAEVKPPEVTQEDTFSVFTVKEQPSAKLEAPSGSRVRFSILGPEVFQESAKSVQYSPSLSEDPPEPKQTVAEPPEPAVTTPEEEAEIALLQQVFLDQTNQIRALLDLVKLIPILKPSTLCLCQHCKGGLKMEKTRQDLKAIQDATNITPQ